MAPKMERPWLSSISMRTRSPNAMKGVTGAPFSICSRLRRSAMQHDPASPCLLETVPEPTMEPAPSARVLAAWAISCANEIAQGDVVDEHQEFDMSLGMRRVGAHGHVVGDDGDFGFEVDAPGRVRGENRIGWAEETVGATLIH